MFQTIKHIENVNVFGKSYRNHYNSDLSLEATRQAGEQFIRLAQKQETHSVTLCAASGEQGPEQPELSTAEGGGQQGVVGALVWAA